MSRFASERRTAEAKLTEIDRAYSKALTFLTNQLRKDYRFLRTVRLGAGCALDVVVFVAGIPLGIGATFVGGFASMTMALEDPMHVGGYDPKFWDDQVAAELKSATAEIDRIRDDNRRYWQARFDDAEKGEDLVATGCAEAEIRLTMLRATYDQNVQFPKCRCEQ